MPCSLYCHIGLIYIEGFKFEIEKYKAEVLTVFKSSPQTKHIE